jgi:AraC-like DNA-binding protein
MAGTLIIEISILIAGISLSIELYKTLEQFINFVFLLFIGFLGINQSQFLIQVRFYQLLTPDDKKDNGKNLNSEITEDEKNEIRKLIELILKEKKLYFDPNLTIDHLARKIHVPQRKLSLTIHELYGKNFTNFINDYRIQEAVKILNSSERVSIYVLSRNVGFNSRSTFNRAFKDYTGKTPREYVVKHKKSNHL